MFIHASCSLWVELSNFRISNYMKTARNIILSCTNEQKVDGSKTVTDSSTRKTRSQAIAPTRAYPDRLCPPRNSSLTLVKR